MLMTLYQTSSSDEVINKEYNFIAEIDIKLRDKHDILSPTIILGPIQNVDIDVPNYAYINEFKRFYFIRSKVVGPNNLSLWSLECDVLETYKDTILLSQADITRTIQENDYQMVSTNTDSRRQSLLYYGTKSVGEDESYIFATIGQEIE